METTKQTYKERIETLESDVLELKKQVLKLELQQIENRKPLTKGVNCVYMRCFNRRELWSTFRRIGEYLGEEIQYKVYPDKIDNNIHYVAFKTGDNDFSELDKSYEFLSGVYTNHKSNEHRSYLFFSFKDYEYIKNKYSFWFGRNKDKKAFYEYFNAKMKS